ncbi:MAG: Holliday junction resolvase RuvX [Actinomycetota bacterium]|nr:Holliday junction resolvase RuvX [Actinomycetota bacterium]
MRVVGVDLGTRRVGIAVSDSGGRVAIPHTVMVRTGDDTADRARLIAVIGDLEAEAVVVGLPLSLDGSTGPAAQWATDEAEVLRSLLDVPLELHDERLSTVTALRAPVLGGGRKARRKPVDGQAAAVMLQSWLDGRQRAPEEATAP